MSQNVLVFPISAVKHTVGDLVFHGRFGYVRVKKVIGLNREISWEEDISKQLDPLDWAHATGDTKRIHKRVVPVYELFRPSLTPQKLLDVPATVSHLDTWRQKRSSHP